VESSRIQKVIGNHEKGYNCCQAIVCAYCDMFNLDEETVFKVTEGLGFGMGSAGTCGAVSAMVIMAGLKNSAGKIVEPLTKHSTYALDKKLLDMFYNKNKSVMCVDLKGIIEGRNPLRSCNGCIVDGARLVEREIFPGKFEEYVGEEY
jgi:C_GCAxxG_C_C family probable redox protein